MKFLKVNIVKLHNIELSCLICVSGMWQEDAEVPGGEAAMDDSKTLIMGVFAPPVDPEVDGAPIDSSEPITPTEQEQEEKEQEQEQETEVAVPGCSNLVESGTSLMVPKAKALPRKPEPSGGKTAEEETQAGLKAAAKAKATAKAKAQAGAKAKAKAKATAKAKAKSKGKSKAKTMSAVEKKLHSVPWFSCLDSFRMLGR